MKKWRKRMRASAILNRRRSSYGNRSGFACIILIGSWVSFVIPFAIHSASHSPCKPLQGLSATRSPNGLASYGRSGASRINAGTATVLHAAFSSKAKPRDIRLLELEVEIADLRLERLVLILELELLLKRHDPQN